MIRSAAKSKFVLGPSTVPGGRQGPWVLEDFEISEEAARRHNSTLSRRPPTLLFKAIPGRYKRLKHDSRGVVMANTLFEVVSRQHAFDAARGVVLINGLGMGMMLEAVLAKPEVERVRVVEIDADLIRLVGPRFAHDSRVVIVHDNAHTYRPPRSERYGFVWHDIWDKVDPDNLESMKDLLQKYRRLSAGRQECWSHDLLKVAF